MELQQPLENVGMPTMEEEAVDVAIHKARQAITDLWHMRLRNDTADILCFEYEALCSMRNMLGAICEDVWHANENAKRAAQ